MVDKLLITKIDECFVGIECERSTAQELSDYFEFYVPGYQFVPAYRSKFWDGKIRLFNQKNNTIYRGLIPHIEKFCREREYVLSIDPSLQLTENFSIKEAQEFVNNLKPPFEPRDYQIDSFVHAIRNKRLLLLSPTASGKSFICYLILRYLQASGKKKGLLIVPTTSLCYQMFKDFDSYSINDPTFNVDDEISIIMAGKDKNPKVERIGITIDSTVKYYKPNTKIKTENGVVLVKNLPSSEKILIPSPFIITTWQSIYTLPKEYFEQFDFVLGDEAHQFKSKSLTTIMTGLKNASHRIGCTGTLDGTQTHRLVLEGLFGAVYKATTTKELIDNQQLAEFKIKCLILKYPKETCKLSRSWDYNAEVDYIVGNTARNRFIKNLALSIEGNSLILYRFVEKHGRELYRIINEGQENRKVFFVFGGTDVNDRELVREITEKESNAIIIASYGTFSTGINIRNLHNIIFASPSKSRIRNLQSIGRGLRKGNNKTEAILFDIADDFRQGKVANHTLKHFAERVKIYDEEKFPYKFYNIELHNG